jgi:hypothetical protein
MIISCSKMMRYTPLLLLSVLSVLLIPLLQTAHAQNPLDQLIGGLKNLTSGASKAVNNTASQAGQSTSKAAGNASQSMNNTAGQAGQSVSKAAGNASESMNKTAGQAGQALENTTKAVGSAIQKGIAGIMNLGNNTAK